MRRDENLTIVIVTEKYITKKYQTVNNFKILKFGKSKQEKGKFRK